MLPNPPLFTGGPSETRTPNLLIKSLKFGLLSSTLQFAQLASHPLFAGNYSILLALPSTL